VPRFGTVSPWSSKATDIAHVCGLGTVTRIERGVAYFIVSSQPLSKAEHAQVAAVIHDRMTESVLDSIDAAAGLFAHHSPQPLAIVPVLAQGRAALERANAELGSRCPMTRSITWSPRLPASCGAIRATSSS